MYPVLLEYGRLRLFSYGVMIALGGLLSCRFWRGRQKQMGLAKEEDFWLLVNVVLLTGFLGGRALYLLEYTRPFSRDFWEALCSFSR